MEDAQLKADWAAWEGRTALVEAFDSEEFAFMAFVGLGKGALVWLDRPIPALAGRTPRACLETRHGRKQVGQLLARLPR